MSMKLSFIMEGNVKREFEVEKFALLDGGYYFWSKEDLGDEFRRVSVSSREPEAYEINPNKTRVLGFIIA